MEDQLAIKVSGAHSSYGSLKVLKGLDMEVPHGCIYGLLGSSGCGKTTLLRSILGRLDLSDGHIEVLGREPGSRGHTIPGKDVGYMPQELALFGDFTMLETMYYFGMLYEMNRSKVRERSQFLVQLLELPTARKTIKKLSGGQQRRVSFAVAMLQEPPLLILDEPTVGVDPLLRAKIWQHLLDMVQNSSTTIVITTHYIEEARQAHMVGLMRDGCLLAQSPPNALIQAHGMTTLEEVFLSLCRDQDQRPLELSCHSIEKVTDEKANDDTGMSVNEETPLIKGKRTASINKPSLLQRAKKKFKSSFCKPVNPANFVPRPRNIAALVWKNFTRIYRNPGLLLFQFFLPTFQMAIFCLAIGGDLSGVNVAVVNSDRGYNDSPISFVCDHFQYMNDFGSLFLSQLDTNMLNLNYFNNTDDAIDEVKHGNAWMAIIVPENFTEDLTKRVMAMVGGNKVPQELINGSTIEIYEDVTNLQMTYSLQNATTSAVEEMIQIFIENCSVPKDEISSPIKIHNPPVYGNLHLSYTDYIAPGMLISITFGISIGLTALSFVIERKEGLIDRTWVAGVNVTEMVLAQIVTQFFILLVQIILLVVVAKFVFQIYTVYLKSLILVGALSMMQGLTGMTYGLFISSLCQQETSAIQVMAGSYYPILILSGIIWPLEGMPVILRYISYAFPTTYAAEAMRSIMERGWGLEELAVWRGFLMTIAWFVLFVTLATIGLRLRK